MSHFMTYHFVRHHFVKHHFMTRHFVEPTVILLLSLAGCSSVSETFDSAPGQGVGAKPITVVNHMVEHKQLKGSSLQGSSLQGSAPENNSLQNKSWQRRAYRSVPHGTGDIRRQSEKTMRIWMAPHIDDQGHLHEGSYVHTVIQPSTWSTQPSDVQKTTHEG